MTHRPPTDSYRQFEDFDELREHLRSLPDDALMPDMTNRILGEVGRRRGWVGRSQRRMLVAARLLIGGAALGVVAGTLLLQRHAPTNFVVEQPAQPLGSLVRTVTAESQPVRSFVLDPAQVRTVIIKRPISAATQSLASLGNFSRASVDSSIVAGSSPMVGIDAPSSSSALLDFEIPTFGFPSVPSLRSANPPALQTTPQSMLANWRSMDMLSSGVTWTVPTLVGFDGEPIAVGLPPEQATSQDEQSDDR